MSLRELKSRALQNKEVRREYDEINEVKPATFESVKRAGAVGDAAFEYFKKYGKLPENREQLREFLHNKVDAAD